VTAAGLVFEHVVYGLRLASALALPELTPSFAERGTLAHGSWPAVPDVVVRPGPVEDVPATISEAGVARASADEVVLVWPGIGAFRMCGGTEIVVDASPGADPSIIGSLLLGPALAVILHQRNRLVLHASAVAMGGGAVAFLGDSGWGKSTMAAALHARGFGVVTDDVLALYLDEPRGPVAHPGVPRLSLAPEVVHAFVAIAESLPRLPASDGKRAYAATSNFRAAPVPLRRLYVLADAERSGLDAMIPRDAAIELVRHSYTARLLGAVGPAAHLRRCARLAARVAVRRLRRPRSLSALARLAAMVEEDVAGSAVGAHAAPPEVVDRGPGVRSG
jgi:hypothetical protein